MTDQPDFLFGRLPCTFAGSNPLLENPTLVAITLRTENLTIANGLAAATYDA